MDSANKGERPCERAVAGPGPVAPDPVVSRTIAALAAELDGHLGYHPPSLLVPGA